MDDAPAEHFDPPLRKEALRKLFKSKRNQLSRSDIERTSLQLRDQLAATDELLNASVIGLYWPIRNEIDPAQIAEHPLFADTIFVWPKTDVSSKRLSFHLPETTTKQPGEPGFLREVAEHFKPGPYGILEPQGPGISDAQIALILVPGLGFDHHGHRLGYGGGYYDRYLSQHEHAHITVGVGFDWQLVDLIPTHQHDQPIHIVATPSVLIRPSGAALKHRR